jgi:hypothetical protein
MLLIVVDVDDAYVGLTHSTDEMFAFELYLPPYMLSTLFIDAFGNRVGSIPVDSDVVSMAASSQVWQTYSWHSARQTAHAGV